MKFAASLSKLLAALRASDTTLRGEVAALPAPLIVALEPRIVYDASAASIGAAAVAAQHHTNADTQSASAAGSISAGAEIARASASNFNAPASMRAVHGYTPAAVAAGESAAITQNAASMQGVVAPQRVDTTTASLGGAGDSSAIRAVHGFTDTAVKSTDTQVVFVNSNVSDYQTLVAGLPQNTQVVILDSTKDGLVQIEQYLQQHPGVSAIHLVSHGSDGNVQIGSTWLNAGDLSTYSAELAQIGAAMKPGGDFLIYGCDVAQNTDGKALVQQIASMTGLNVAASTDATGATSLGGDWVLEYDAGTVHTGVVFSAAAEQRYDHLLTLLDETYDSQVGFDTGPTPVASTLLDGLTYTGDQAVEYQVVSGSLPSSPSGGELIVNTQGTLMSSLTVQRQDGALMAVQSFDIDIFVSSKVTVEALDSSGNILGTIDLTSSAGATAYTPGHVANSSVFHVSLSGNAAFAQVKSIKLIESSGDGTYLSPTLDNFTYIEPSSPPVLTATGGSASFVAGDNATSTPVVVDSGITLTDGNSSTAASATVSITGNLHNTEDVLAFTNTSASTYGNIAASYNAVTGVLTLTSAAGTATTAQWQAAMRAVTYTDTAITPNSTTRTISFQITSDGYTAGNTTTKTVTVTDTDQTPIVTTAGHTATYHAGGSSATIDSSITVSDRDNTTQSSGTVSISTGFQSGDTLNFTNDGSTMGNITGSYNAATGVLTLTSAGATSTDAQWQHALSAVSFSSSSTTLGNRTISYTTSDGTKTSAAATDTVNVLSPVQITADSGSAAFVAGDNAASTPVAVDSGLTLTDVATSTLSTATVAITGGFTSGEDVLSFTNNGSTMGNITGSYSAATGVLTLTSSGSSATVAQWQSALEAVKYTDTAVTPNNATRTVSFTAVDSLGNTSNTATRTVTVTDTDQTPIVSTTGGTTNYVGASSAVTIDGGVSVSDLDNTTQSSGTVSVSGGFHSGDTLSFTNTSSAFFGNIAASYNAATGVLTLTSAGATATDAQWTNALSSVAFSSTSTTYGNRTISFATSDGTKTSAARTDTVNMTAPPTITTDAGSAAFVAGDNATSTPVAIDSGLTVTDGSATTLSATTVAITGGFHSVEDRLAFTNDGATMGNIVGSYNAATGVLTLTSSGASATLAQWQSALQSVTYTDTAVTPNNATRTISFTAVDGAGNTSATATRTVTITDTDQTPIVATTGGTTNYVGGTSAVTIDGGISVSDLDNTTQSTGTVSITSGLHSGDTLTFVNTNSTTFGNIVASYNSATGVLTLTSPGATASNAQWSHALSAVTFSAGSSATPGNRTVSFTVNDGIKTSAVRTDTVDVLGPPTITTDSGSAAFVAGDNAASTPVAIDSGLTLTDGVSPTLASATVAVTGNFHSGEDVLAFTNDGATMGNIAGSYNSGTGVLTLTSSGATATLAQWQAALEAVAYTDTAVTPNNATRTISFTALDTGAFTSNTATRTVTVSDTDQTPIVTTTGGTANYVGGTSAVTIDGGISVSDLDNTTQSTGTVSITSGLHSGDTLTFVNTNSTTFGNIVASYNSATGVLTLTSSGATASNAQWSHALSAVTFSAGSSATPGGRTVSFAVNDGTKTSAVGTDTVDVLGPPTITTDSGSAAFVAADNATSAPVAIDSGLTLTDGAASTLASATVSITGNFHAGEDGLAFGNTSSTTYGNISASYNASTGVLTLTSAGASATVAQWQAALDSVTYTDTAVTPNNATRTISFTAVDAASITSNTATRTVTVTDTDQSPIVATTGGATPYVAGASATIVNSNMSVTDLDNATQSAATVSITGNYHSGEDVLAFTNANTTAFGNIAATFNAATGMLTLTSAGATATDAQWANALSAVTFSSTGAHYGNRTVSYATSDGVKTSAAANVTVSVLDRPRVGTDAGSGSFVAGDNVVSAPIVVSPGLTLSDASSTTAVSATVSVTSGFHAGEDVLAFNNDGATMGNIAASYDANTGVLTLTSAGGTASLSQWQAALASLTYTDTAVTPDTTTRVISFTLTDGNGTASDAQTRSVTVADTDQTPLVTIAGGGTFTARGAGSTPVVVAPQVTISDRDNPTLASAQVTISGGFDPGHDTLAFTASAATGNITASYDAATGVMTLASAGGTATIAQWSAALQSVTYAATSSHAGSSRTVTVTVNDGAKTSAAASNTIAITNASLLPPILPPSPPTVVVTPGPTHSSPFAGNENTAPPDVLDEFDQSPPIGSVPVTPTITFADPSAPATHSLDRTTVPRADFAALNAAPAVLPIDVPIALPDVSFAMAPNDPFSISVATLLPASEAMHGGSDVTVRLADGRSLPGWIHYDAASGALRGKLPAGVEDVRIVVQTRDASGRETRREIVLAPHDRHGASHGAPHGVTHPKAPGHAALAEPSVVRTARPVGKPSLDQQFAQARAALHVSSLGDIARRA